MSLKLKIAKALGYRHCTYKGKVHVISCNCLSQVPGRKIKLLPKRYSQAQLFKDGFLLCKVCHPKPITV